MALPLSTAGSEKAWRGFAPRVQVKVKGSFSGPNCFKCSSGSTEKAARCQ